MTTFGSRLGSRPRVVGAVLVGACATVACSSSRPAPGAAGESAPPIEVAGLKEPAPASSGLSSTAALADPRTNGAIGAPAPPQPPPDLYDPDTIPKFELTLDAAAMATLSSATLETKDTSWVHGQFKFGAITFADVGVRPKGTSTFRVLPNKGSLKVKFNKWVKGQKLYGLEEITLNNMTSDPTCLAERLAYHVFRSVGLPASKANTAQLTINGEDYGVYANVESPNENFLARVFGQNARTLYEVNWGSSWLPGGGGETGFDIRVPLPNAPPETKPDVDVLFQAVKVANDATLIADLEGHLRTREWLHYAATEAMVGHYDGYAYGLWGSHNYFMAGDTDGRFSLIPWSTDLSLSDRAGVPDAANPRNATVLTRCRGSASCWAAYKTEMQSVLAVYETLDLVKLATRWHDQIDALVKADPKRESTLDYHASEVERLYGWLAARPSVVRTQLGL